jgi:hypothetical protein
MRKSKFRVDWAIGVAWQKLCLGANDAVVIGAAGARPARHGQADEQNKSD